MQQGGDGAYAKPSAPLLGNLLTLVASVGYGLYQVLYNQYGVLPAEFEETGEWRGRRLSLPPVGAEESTELSLDNPDPVVDDAIRPPPFGLYANLLTSSMGLITLCFLWIPLPILHFTGVEPFALPHDFHTWCSVGGIALSGVTFYMCFMILLGVWGPIVTSAGNLLTIVLVLITDIALGNAMDSLTAWSLLGSGMIVCAFAVLAYETFHK